ncbi:hypothetical protein [Flavobacterium sp. 3HN19-14]|uniref:hypothetical protein n=1 Tax=Flavobacterium sp. 3HN19-14 TaxID=3448133 RepID=UPI003EE34A99
MNDDFQFKFITPENEIADFTESIGMFQNSSDEAKEIVIVPDGRIDLFFWKVGQEPWQVILIGLETFPEQRSVPPKTTAFTISFRPLAVEYILKNSIAGIINTAKILPDDFWGFNEQDFTDFETFSAKAAQKITSLLPTAIDERKTKTLQINLRI